MKLAILLFPAVLTMWLLLILIMFLTFGGLPIVIDGACHTVSLGRDSQKDQCK